MPPEAAPDLTPVPEAPPAPAPEGGSSTVPPVEGSPPSEAGSAAAPAEGQPQEDKNRESAIARNLQQREQRLIQQQQAFRRQQDQARIDVQRQIADAIAEERKKWDAEYEADPIGFGEKRGKDKNFLAGRILNDGKQTPEEVAKRAIEKAEGLEKQLAERAAAESRQRAETDFRHLMKTTEADHAALHDEWDHDEIVQQAYALVGRLRAKNEERIRAGLKPISVTDAEILKHLDGQAQKRQARRVERSKGKTADETNGKAAPQGAPKADGNGTAPKATTAGTQNATTLSGRLSSERQTVNLDSDHKWLEAPPDEQRSLLLAEIEKTRQSMMNGKT